MVFKKQYILFIALAVFAFGLIFPRISLGDYCSTGCPECYHTECGEEINIGECCDEECCRQECEIDPDTGQKSYWCVEECKVCSCGGNWPEYKCDSPDCDGNILVRTCSVYKDCGPCAMGSCEDECCCVSCTASEICEDCGSWQKPIREPCLCPKWGRIKPECKCSGECIDTPDDSRYYGDPRFYKNPFYPPAECDLEKEWDIYPIAEYNPDGKWRMDSNNVYLPVKLDWDDIRGWKDSWKEEGECVYVKECESGDRSCIESYSGIEDCKIDCKKDCYKELKDLTLEKELREEGLREYQERYAGCLRDCDNECEETYKSNAGGCSETCPYPDQCHLTKEYIQSYVIKIEGEIRNCEALKTIDELEKLIEKAKTVMEIEGYKTQIEWIRETELEISEYEEVLDKSEFIPPCSCMFKSNRTYRWKVRACCPTKEALETISKTERDEACGPWSDWQFTTNPAPEPKLPYDPDWSGLFRMKNLTKEEIEKLKWCEIDDQKIYKPTYLEDKIHYKPLSDTQFLYYSEEYTAGENEGKEQYLCHPNLIESEVCKPQIILFPKAEGGLLFPPFEFWDQNHSHFTKITPYAWKTSACKEVSALECTDYSQEWRFSAENFLLETPRLINPLYDPAGETPVGLPVTLSVHAPYAMSFIFEISGLGQIKSSTPGISLDYPRLNLDTLYTWYVTPCWGYKSEPEKCEHTSRAGPFYFKTTGELIRIIYPKPGATDIPIPIKFEWEKVPGANSYIFTLEGKEPVVLQSTEILADYPELRQKTNYSWQVQTCARANGTACGAEANQNFTTFKLRAPVNPGPENGAVLTTAELRQFSWDKILGAKFYQFQIEYLEAADGEEKECLEKEGEKITKIIAENSTYLLLECKGKYRWQVKGCLDENCQESGDWNVWRFDLVSEGGGAPGLVPCGRTSDNPDTPWDETKSCGIRHIFIMIKVIVDFVLFTLAPICLILLIAASGVMFYFSLKAESATPLAKVKSLWKAAGIGFGILLFIWTIISIIFNLIGYQFGPWWRF